MNEVINLLQDHLGPLALQLLGIAFAAIATLALNTLRKYLGEKNTRAIVDLLHTALESGVKAQITDGATNTDVIAKAAVEYARHSIPDTLTKLNPAYSVLLNIAKSKIKFR